MKDDIQQCCFPSTNDENIVHRHSALVSVSSRLVPTCIAPTRAVAGHAAMTNGMINATYPNDILLNVLASTQRQTDQAGTTFPTCRARAKQAWALLCGSGSRPGWRPNPQARVCRTGFGLWLLPYSRTESRRRVRTGPPSRLVRTASPQRGKQPGPPGASYDAELNTQAVIRYGDPRRAADASAHIAALTAKRAGVQHNRAINRKADA